MGSPEFEAWWREYPNKSGKPRAWASWQRLEPPADKCMATLAWQRRSEKWLNGYVLEPFRWLDHGHWEDEPPQTARALGYSEREVAGRLAGQAFINGAPDARGR